MSLKDQSSNYYNYEIIIIDNNSTDSTPLLCMEFLQQKGDLNVHYYKETQQGLSYARNRGIAVAQGEIIAFIDDDAVACRDYVLNIIEWFDNHSECAAIGGRIFPKYETQCPTWMPEQLMPLFSILNLGEKPKEFTRNLYPVGANMAFRKSVFTQYGLFKTELGRTGKNLLGGEEKDIFFRLKKHKLAIWYVPYIWVYHIIPQQRTTKDFIMKQAIGVGQSEYFRSKSNIVAYSSSICKELIKWGVSKLLALGYTIQAKPQKAAMILQFRYYVSLGLLGIKRV
jgi:glycosyltransferase involved in cell wall biosynthesis